MSFSPRATQLMRELERHSDQLNSRIARIADALNLNANLNTEEVSKDVAAIEQIAQDIQTLMSRVQEGPDAPLTPRGFPAHPARVTWPALTAQANRMQGHFARWRTLSGWIRKRLQFDRAPLYPPSPPKDSIAAVQDDTSNTIFNLLHTHMNPGARDEHASDQGGNRDIGLPQSWFIQHMHAAHRLTLAQHLGRPARFLDVGCGAGFKVFSATQFFEPANGFDVVESFVEASQRLLQSWPDEKARVFTADALTFSDYGAYDVIYCYSPFNVSALQTELEDRILSSARPGSLFIAPHTWFRPEALRTPCAHVAGHIYLVQSKDDEAEALREKAERIGPYPSPHDSGAETIWSPIQNALRDCGFHCRQTL